MNGLEQVKAAVATAIQNAGGRTVDAFPPDRAKCFRSPVVAVGLRTGSSAGGALQCYLGQSVDPVSLAPRDVYGLHLDITLSLDIYSPPSLGAAACDQTLEILHNAVLHFLPSGLKPSKLSWDDAVWDNDSAMFLRKGSLACSAFFTASSGNDGPLFDDFILKGVVSS